MVNKQKSEFKFNELVENRLVDYLRIYHLGKKNAIPHKLLATRLGINPRRLRALISHLVREHEIPIGSLSGSDIGIFYVATKDEMEQVYEELFSRASKIILRAFSLEQAYFKSVKNQLKLLDV